MRDSQTETLAAHRVRVVSIALAVVFAVLSAFHIAWAVGDAPTAVMPAMPGRPQPRPSAFGSLTVAVALALAALIVLARGRLIFANITPRLVRFSCAALGLVFVLRAIGEFRVLGFFKSISDSQFAIWDTWLYSPLSLALGVGCVWLAVGDRFKRR